MRIFHSKITMVVSIRIITRINRNDAGLRNFAQGLAVHPDEADAADVAADILSRAEGLDSRSVRGLGFRGLGVSGV